MENVSLWNAVKKKTVVPEDKTCENVLSHAPTLEVRCVHELQSACQLK